MALCVLHSAVAAATIFGDMTSPRFASRCYPHGVANHLSLKLLLREDLTGVVVNFTRVARNGVFQIGHFRTLLCLSA